MISVSVIDEYLQMICMIECAKKNLYENKKIDLEFKKSYLQKYEDLLKRQYQLLWDFTIEIMGGEKCK